MGGSVDIGAAALRQAALCWWRKYCITMLLSLLATGVSLPAPRPLCSGGLTTFCLIVALQDSEHMSSKAPSIDAPWPLHRSLTAVASTGEHIAASWS